MKSRTSKIGPAYDKNTDAMCRDSNLIKCDANGCKEVRINEGFVGYCAMQRRRKISSVNDRETTTKRQASKINSLDWFLFIHLFFSPLFLFLEFAVVSFSRNFSFPPSFVMCFERRFGIFSLLRDLSLSLRRARVSIFSFEYIYYRPCVILPSSRSYWFVCYTQLPSMKFECANTPVKWTFPSWTCDVIISPSHSAIKTLRHYTVPTNQRAGGERKNQSRPRSRVQAPVLMD